MTMFQTIGHASDRVMATLVAGLEQEFGSGADAGLAARYLAAEESDFLWDARIEERWLSAYESLDENDVELDRIAILARLDGRWIAALMLVDGDGLPHGTMVRRGFPAEGPARKAWLHMR